MRWLNSVINIVYILLRQKCLILVMQNIATTFHQKVNLPIEKKVKIYNLIQADNLQRVNYSLINHSVRHPCCWLHHKYCGPILRYAETNMIFIKFRVIHGSSGSGKYFLTMYLSLYAISHGLKKFTTEILHS